MSGRYGELTSDIVLCVMQRGDGVGLSATSHDRQKVFGDIPCDPSPSLAPTEMILSSDLFASSLSFNGALSSEGLQEKDLAAGRWSEASVVLSIADWTGKMPTETLCRGELGAVSRQDGVLSGDCSLVPSRAKGEPCPRTSAECRAVLGDRRCRVPMRKRRLRLRLLSIDRQTLFVSGEPFERFRMGGLRWLTGPNSGLEQVIIDTGNGVLILRERPAHEAQVGDQILLTEGCDGRLQTCRDRFNNVVNFRGEPHLPGTDFITRYPGA